MAANDTGASPNTNVSDLKENDNVNLNGQAMTFNNQNEDGSVSMTDAQGNQVTGNVDESGNIQSVTMAANDTGASPNTNVSDLKANDNVNFNGQEMTFNNQNEDGSVSMTDAQGNQVTGNVDKSGNIQSVTMEVDNATTSPNTNVSDLKANDNVNFNGQEMTFNNQNEDGSVSMTDAQGNQVTGDVDENGNIQSVTMAVDNATTSPNTNISDLKEDDSVNFNGQEMTFNKQNEDGSVSMTDAQGNQVTGDVDENGNIQSVTMAVDNATTSPNTNISDLKEDDSVNFNGQEMTFNKQNEDGSVSMTDAKGNQVTGDVDKNGNIQSVTTAANESATNTNRPPQTGIDGASTDINTLQEGDQVDFDGGQYTLEQMNGADEAIMTDTSGNEFTAELDSNGNITEMRPNGDSAANTFNQSVAAATTSGTETPINDTANQYEAKPLSSEEIAELGTINESTIEAQSRNKVDANSVMEQGLRASEKSAKDVRGEIDPNSVIDVSDYSGWSAMKH